MEETQQQLSRPLLSLPKFKTADEFTRLTLGIEKEKMDYIISFTDGETVSIVGDTKHSQILCLIIPDLLSMFLKDPQVKAKEAKDILKQIVSSIRKFSLNNNILSLVSLPFHDIFQQLEKFLMIYEMRSSYYFHQKNQIKQ